MRHCTTFRSRSTLGAAAALALLDAETGTTLAEKSHPAFLRLSAAGDGRHAMVSDSDTFRVYDTGIQARSHGDHEHHVEATPGLTDVTFPAPHAGHVVLHHGRTMLFADGTGEITSFDSDKITSPEKNLRSAKTDHPHHGVAVELSDGSLFTTQGTTESRSVVQVRKGGRVVAETRNCPGSHGEATAAPTPKGDVVVMGCENGPVVYRDGAFHKVKVADAYARSGNLVGHENSPIVLGDYKVDKDAKPERPTRVSLVDTRTDTLRLLDLRSPYWFRSFARGPKGEGLVLTYDGRLHVLDVEKGTRTASIPVVSPWKEKDDWQEPGPAVKVAGGRAYVTDAEKKTVSVVDLAAKKVVNTYPLPHTPVEIAVTTGHPEAPADDAHGHGHEHGHDAHGHDGTPTTTPTRGSRRTRTDARTPTHAHRRTRYDARRCRPPRDAALAASAGVEPVSASRRSPCCGRWRRGRTGCVGRRRS